MAIIIIYRINVIIIIYYSKFTKGWKQYLIIEYIRNEKRLLKETDDEIIVLKRG